MGLQKWKQQHQTFLTFNQSFCRCNYQTISSATQVIQTVNVHVINLHSECFLNLQTILYVNNLQTKHFKRLIEILFFINSNILVLLCFDQWDCSCRNKSINNICEKWQSLIFGNVLIPHFIRQSVFWQNYRWTLYLRWETNPHMNGFRMPYCQHNTELMVIFTFSFLFTFSSPLRTPRDHHQKKNFIWVVCCHTLVLPAKCQPGLDYVLEISSCCLSWHISLTTVFPKQALHW